MFHTDGGLLRGVVLHQGEKTMQTIECVLWHNSLKCEVVFDQGGLSRGGLLYLWQESDITFLFQNCFNL